MRNLILTLCLFCSLHLFGQMPTGENGRFSYTEVVEVPGTASDLYGKGKEWFAKTYNSAQSVIQMDDKAAGRIVGKGLVEVSHRSMGRAIPAGYINYTVSLYLKDGKYKYEVTDLHHTGNGKFEAFGPAEEMAQTKRKMYQKVFNEYLTQADEHIKALTQSLKTTMAAKAATDF